MNPNEILVDINELINNLDLEEIMRFPYKNSLNKVKEFKDEKSLIVNMLINGLNDDELMFSFIKLIVKTRIVEKYKTEPWQEISAKVDAYFKQKFQI